MKLPDGKMKKILIVEDNVALSQLQKEWLKRDGYAVTITMSESVTRRLIKNEPFDLILSDVRLPEGNGIELLKWMKKNAICIPFVIMTEYASFPDAVCAIKLGAKDYLPKPVFQEQLLELVHKLLKNISTIRSNKAPIFKRTSPQARNVERLALLAAPVDISVLILGANGTGKEFVAQTIHRNSSRKDMPFIAVNCGAIPRELASSFFFGHAKGAFTGADADKEGYFDIAKGGTLFLDEIGNLPYEIQSMLLRVLQENEYTPTGSHKERRADVRILTATNEDLQRAIQEGRFREDLYHRLNEFEIYQPTLAECKDDILPLANFFRELYAKEFRHETTGFSKEAEISMLHYEWPGNVRELQNKIRRAVLISESSQLTADDVGFTSSSKNVSSINTGKKNELQNRIEEEKDRIMYALEKTNGNLSESAKTLKMSRPTLYNKLRKYNLK